MTKEENERAYERISSMGAEFGEWYKNHTIKETLEYFGITEKRALYRIMSRIGKERLGIDYNKHAESCKMMKGRKSTRTHEDFMRSAALGAKTQRENWARKSEEEKEAWREKMRESHSSTKYKERMREETIAYRESLSPEREAEINMKRSETMRKWWSGLTPERKAEEIKKHLDGGACWNHEKIRKTVEERYGVGNISQVNEIKKTARDSMRRTCLEKYGVEWNCQLPQCDVRNPNSKPNNDFDALLTETGIAHKREFPLEGYKYDFKVGDALIEINPTATHNSTFGIHGKPKPKDYHMLKSEVAERHGYRCIHVFDWDDWGKAAMLLKPRERVYARDTEAREVPKKEADSFCEEYHLQGKARHSYALGLYRGDELVSLMTFGKPRYSKKHEWELVRYCSKADVVGGAEKLMSHFISEKSPKSIVSYCDKSKFSGKTYADLGFSLIRKGRPSKHWYSLKSKKHFTNATVVRLGFSKLTGIYEGLDTDDNDVLMLEHGFVEVYDCGQDTWEWKASPAA